MKNNNYCVHIYIIVLHTQSLQIYYYKTLIIIIYGPINMENICIYILYHFIIQGLLFNIILLLRKFTIIYFL
jgi:hypothetical protein